MNYMKVLLISFTLFFSGVALATEVSLRDKIGQMLIIGFEGKTVNKKSPIIKTINETSLGGVILFDFNFQTNTFDKNIESPAQVKELNQQLQEANQKANKKHHRPQLPLLISVDYEGGAVNRLSKNYGFPETFSAAVVGKMALSEASKVADLMGKTLEESGFNLDFAPILDLNVNPDNPIISKLERSFSANPSEVAKYSHLFSRAFLQRGVQCAYKHFPGHGSATADSHLGFVDVTATWQASELEPYRLLANEDNSCGMIMTAHIVNRRLDDSGLPATLSHKVLTDVLRKQLQFKGVIITDDMQMKAISEHYGLERALPLAINAGADMFIFGNQLMGKSQDPKQVIDLIEAKVHSGEISQSRIDEAYQHIIAFKRSTKRI